MSYRVAYGPDAAKALDSMPASLRRSFDRAMDSIARDPYGSGSSAIRGERDHRDATVAGCFVVYYVSRSVLTVTVVRIQHM